MANQPSKQQNAGKAKERKLLLGNLFVDASVKTEPQEPQKVVVAGLAEANIKKEYPDTFFGRATAVLRGEFSTLFKGALFFVLFTLPFILVIALAAGYFENYILGDSFNFMGNLGVGYPGFTDSIPVSVASMLWDVKQPVLMMLAGAGIIASIGMAGVFYTAKRSYFQDVYKKIPRTYFIGIGKYWWKFLAVSTFGILVTLAMGTAMLYLLSQQTLGNASAGAYCGVVFSFLIGLPLLAYCMVLLSLFTVYDLSFKDAMKDALVIAVNCPVMVLLTGVLSAAPLLLLMISNIIAIIVYVVMVLVGFVLIALCWVAMANRGMTKCSNLYSLQFKKVSAYAKNGAKTKSVKGAAGGNVKKTAKQSSANEAKKVTPLPDAKDGEAVKKKPPQKQQYQNPKKKRKK